MVATAERDFQRVWLTAGLTTLGDAVSSIVFPLIAIAVFDASTLTVAALIAADQAAWLFLGLPVGVWMDRLPVRKVLQVSYAIRAVLLASVPLAYVMDRLTLTHVFVVALLTGVATVFAAVGQLAIVPKVVERSRLVNANGRLSATTTATSLGGQSAAGWVIGLLTAPIGLLVEGVTSALAAFVMGTVQEPARPDPGTTPNFVRELKEGLRYTVAHPMFRVITSTNAVINALVAAQYALVFVFLARTLDVPAAWIGVLIAFSGAGGLVGAATSSRLTARFGSGRTWRAALLAGPVAGLAVPLASPGAGLALFALGSTGLAAAMAVVSVIGGSARQAACPPELIGRMSATSRSLTWGVIPLGALAGGVLGSAFGIREALWLVAVAFFIAPALVLISPLRRVRELETADQGDSGLRTG